MSIKQLMPAENVNAVIIEDGRVIRLRVLLFGLCKEDEAGEKYDTVSPFVYIPDLNRIDKIDDYDEYVGLEMDDVTLPDDEWLKRMEELKAEEEAAEAEERTGEAQEEGQSEGQAEESTGYGSEPAAEPQAESEPQYGQQEAQPEPGGQEYREEPGGEPQGSREEDRPLNY